MGLSRGRLVRVLSSRRDVFHAGGVGAGSPGCEATPGYGRKRTNNPGGVEGSGAFAPLPGCVFLIVRAVPGCVLRTTRGYRLPSLRDERGDGEGVRWVEFVRFHPSGMKEAVGMSRGAGWEATGSRVVFNLPPDGGSYALPRAQSAFPDSWTCCTLFTHECIPSSRVTGSSWRCRCRWCWPLPCRVWAPRVVPSAANGPHGLAWR
jgi:hypothetical protein